MLELTSNSSSTSNLSAIAKAVEIIVAGKIKMIEAELDQSGG